MLDVTPVLRQERAAFVELLASLDEPDWDLPTECPAYSVKGVATHVLGDDLSLLSRQRDGATNGLLLMAEGLAGADFRTILDAFNDGWVSTARFFGTDVLVDLLRAVGDWTSDFYESVDLEWPCEPVFFFGSTGDPSPYWQAIAREFMERWVHHSQILRALGRPSLADEVMVRTGVDVVAAAANVGAWFEDGRWSIGAAVIGSTSQTADILTRRYRAEEVRNLVNGPSGAVELAAESFGR